MLDPGGLITFMNPSAERMTDTALPQAVGRHWKDVFTIKVEDPVQDQTGSLVEILLERPILITKSGNTIPIELEISPVADANSNPIGSMLILHDVTDLNLEKEGLKESRAKYKRLVNSIEGIVWEAEGESINIHFVSEYAETLLGYSPRFWTKQPDFWKKIIHTEDLQSVLDVITQSVKQKENYQIEYRIVASDGRVLLVRDSVTISVNDSGEIRLTGVITDVTMSKQARDKLVKLQEMFSEAFYSNPAALLLISESGKILDANESYEKLTGYFHEELVDRSIMETGLCTKEQFDSLLQGMSSRDDIANVEWHSRKKRNELLNVSASFHRIKYVNESCFIASFREMSSKN